MEEEDNDNVFVSIHFDTQVVAIALPEDLLLHLDTLILEMQNNPEYPDHMKATPLWAERSNYVCRALAYMFEAEEIEHLWREEPGWRDES